MRPLPLAVAIAISFLALPTQSAPIPSPSGGARDRNANQIYTKTFTLEFKNGDPNANFRGMDSRIQAELNKLDALYGYKVVQVTATPFLRGDVPIVTYHYTLSRPLPLARPPEFRRDAHHTVVQTYGIEVKKGVGLEKAFEDLDEIAARDATKLTQNGYKVTHVTPSQLMNGENLLIAYQYVFRHDPP